MPTLHTRQDQWPAMLCLQGGERLGVVGPRCLRPYQPLALLPCWNGMAGYPAAGCEVVVWFATEAG